MTALKNVAVPYGAYWSTPFSRWQQSFAHLHAIKFAAHVAKQALAERKIDPSVFDHAVLGLSVPQKQAFFGLPWFMSMIGNPTIGGTTIAQACATSARSMASAAHDIEVGAATASLVSTCDRTSNTPVVIYPDPKAMAGAPDMENWILNGFTNDPVAGVPPTATAENCARDWQISTEEQNDVTARRYEQYRDACANDHAFMKRYMTLPFEVPDAKFGKTVATLTGDEGIHDTTREGLSKLKPVIPGGTVTFGTQTHPADGNAAVIMTSVARAAELSKDPNVKIEILSFGQARSKPGYMPFAPVPAAKQALDSAGISLKQIDAIKTHNPFVVNDIVFQRETGYDAMKMNNFGSSLVYGHPQGPTGMRLIIELIEELVQKGGGYGLFTGCAAGDTGMALVLKVTNAKKH